MWKGKAEKEGKGERENKEKGVKIIYNVSVSISPCIYQFLLSVFETEFLGAWLFSITIYPN